MTLAVGGLVGDAPAWVAASRAGVVTTVAEGGVLDRAEAAPPAGPKHTCLRRVVYPPARVAELPGAAAVGDSGAVVTRDGCLVLDSIMRLFDSPHRHDVWTFDPDHDVHVGGRAGLALCHGSRNFSHALADLVARVWQIRSAGDEPEVWITPSDPPSWLEELLDELHIPAAVRVIAGPGRRITAERLVIATRSGFAPATAVWAREAVRDQFGIVDFPADLRLLVRRGHAARRRWNQEEASAAALRAHGVESVVMEELPLRRQFALASRAAVIVGAHGAGLSHVLVAPPGGILVEVAGPALDHVDYWGLSSICKWKYHRTSVCNAPFGAPDAALVDIDQPVTAVTTAVERALGASWPNRSR